MEMGSQSDAWAERYERTEIKLRGGRDRGGGGGSTLPSD